MATKPDSTPQGKYLPCPCNPVFHHKAPVAVEVYRGPKQFFIRCLCGLRAYLPPKWTKHYGLTEAQARSLGLLVLTTNLPPSSPEEQL